MSFNQFISDITGRNTQNIRHRSNKPSVGNLELSQGRTLLNDRKTMTKDVGKNYKYMEAFTGHRTILDPVFYKPSVYSEPQIPDTEINVEEPVLNLNKEEMDILKALENEFQQTLTRWSTLHKTVVRDITNLPEEYKNCISQCEGSSDDVDMVNACKYGCNIGQYAVEGSQSRWQRAQTKSGANTGYDVPVASSQYKTTPPSTTETYDAEEGGLQGMRGVWTINTPQLSPGSGEWASDDIHEYGVDPKYQSTINAIQPSKNPSLTLPESTSWWNWLFNRACSDATEGKQKTQYCKGWQQTAGGNSGFYKKFKSNNEGELGPMYNEYIRVGSSASPTKTIKLGGVKWCDPIAQNPQAPYWNDRFAVDMGKDEFTVRRTDKSSGWGQNLLLLCQGQDTCDAIIDGGQSGYCKCLDGRKVGYSDSGHPSFTCNTLCAPENKGAKGVAVGQHKEDPLKANKPLYNNPKNWNKSTTCRNCSQWETHTGDSRLNLIWCYGQNPASVSGIPPDDGCCTFQEGTSIFSRDHCVSSGKKKFCEGSCPGDRPPKTKLASSVQNNYTAKNIKQLPTTEQLDQSCEGANFKNLYYNILELKQVEQQLEEQAELIYMRIKRNTSTSNEIALASTAVGKRLLKHLGTYESVYRRLQKISQSELNMAAMAEDNELKSSSISISYSIWFILAILAMFMVIRHLRK